MNISERIENAQHDVVALRDQLEGLDLDKDATKLDELTARIEETQGNLARLQRLEKALGDGAEPITVPASRTTVYPPDKPLPATAPKAWAVPKKQEEPGWLYLRHCVGKVLSHVRHEPLDKVMADAYGSYGDFDVTKATHEWYVRAATAPATTTTSGWADTLAATQYG